MFRNIHVRKGGLWYNGLKNRRAKGKDKVVTEYMLKTQAVFEVIQRTGAGRFIVEKRMSEMESSGQIRFVDDPRDSRKKLISREHVELVVQALTPS
jgi:transposase